MDFITKFIFYSLLFSMFVITLVYDILSLIPGLIVTYEPVYTMWENTISNDLPTLVFSLAFNIIDLSKCQNSNVAQRLL